MRFLNLVQLKITLNSTLEHVIFLLHLIVAVGLVPALIIYIGLVMQIADMLTSIHLLLDLLFYVVAGLAWIPAASKVVGWLATHESH